MSPGPNQDPFARLVWLDGPAGTAARWWNDRMAAPRPFLEDPERRDVIVKILGTVGTIGVFALVVGRSSCFNQDDGADETMDAIDLQRRTSWDVGDVDRGLSVSDGWSTDVGGGDRWRSALSSGRLAELLSPAEGRLRPFYAPTLFQAPDHSAGRSLVRHLFPIRNAEMDDAYDRGRALAEMFEAAGRPTDTAVVIDLPGPQAVALAAALADLFSPVFTFDNWPHPRGVVPSHRTLDAALYYLPRFESAALHRAASVPPAFVLDANRLAPYRDAASDFDNRYVVSLPSYASLQELGIVHIMYVTATDPVRDSDDLNADLVAVDVAGIDVRAVSTADFQRDPEDAVVGRVAPPDAGAAPPADRLRPHYHYRGGSGGHVSFWRSYGWYEARAGHQRAPVIVETPPPAASYHPTSRETMFASRSFGGTLRGVRPGGFGRITVRSSGGTFHVGSGRSGSFGRGYSSFG